MKTVLLTGAFGNLGTYVLNKLLKDQYRVKAFDLKNPSSEKQASHYVSSSDVEVHWGDIRDEALMNSLVRGCDAIIHLACILPPVTEDNPELTHSVNVKASQTLIAIAEAQPQPPQFLYASSFTVFGVQDSMTKPLSSASPVAPSDHYTRQKMEVEESLSQSTLNFMIGRIAVSIDEDLKLADKRLVQAMFKVKAQNPLEYVHPKDIASAFVHGIGNEAASGKVFVLGGGRNCQVTQIEFVEALMGAAGIQFNENDLGEDTYYTNWLDTDEAQDVLNFQTVSFADYTQDMKRKMRVIFLFVRPLNFIVKPLFKLWLKH